MECAVCTRAERGRRRRAGVALPSSRPLPTPTRGRGEPDRTLRRGPASISPGSARSQVASPISPPNLVGLSIRSRRGSQTQEEETLPTPLQGLSDRSGTTTPPFTPLFPLKNSSRPPTAAPPPPRRNEAKPGPDAAAAAAAATAETGVPRPPPGSGSALGRSLTHQNAHLLLAEEAGEEGGDGEAHGGSCTRDGQEQKGFGASPGLLCSRSRQTEQGGEELMKKEGGSLAGAPGDAPGPESAGRGPARRLPRQLRL